MELGELLDLAAAVRERNDRAEEASRWTATDELLAQVLEMLSIVRTEALAIGGVKRWSLPDPIRVPRPGDKPNEGEIVMSPREFALATAA